MRKSPGQKRSQAKVDEVLSIAEQLLYEMPLEDITPTIIADRAGVTRTSLYHFFPSKFDVYNELAKRYYVEIEQHVVEFFDPCADTDYREAWSGLAGVYRSYFNRNPAAAILLLGHKDAKQTILIDNLSHADLVSNIGNLMTTKTSLKDRLADDIANPDKGGSDIFEVVFNMMTSLFSLGMRKEGKISKDTQSTAEKASIAFLDSSLKN